MGSVYVITVGSSIDGFSRIVGTTGTRENAEKVRTHFAGVQQNLDVMEIQFEDLTARVLSGLYPFEVWVRDDGRVVEVNKTRLHSYQMEKLERLEWSSDQKDGQGKRTTVRHKGVYAVVWAKDETEAIRLVEEKRKRLKS